MHHQHQDSKQPLWLHLLQARDDAPASTAHDGPDSDEDDVFGDTSIRPAGGSSGSEEPDPAALPPCGSMYESTDQVRGLQTSLPQSWHCAKSTDSAVAQPAGDSSGRAEPHAAALLPGGLLSRSRDQV